jgi:hypothetical protein
LKREREREGERERLRESMERERACKRHAASVLSNLGSDPALLTYLEHLDLSGRAPKHNCWP